MNFWILAVDFKSASLEDRARAILPADSLKKVRDVCTESLWLATCNRVLLAGVSELDVEEIKKKWVQEAALDESKLDVYRGERAVLYLLKVVASLESMVIGENQITGQFKKAYDESASTGRAGRCLHRISQGALRAAKRVRQETEIGLLAVSVASVGVKLAEKILGDLSEKSVGVLGVGETGRLAAEHFATALPKELLLYNRTQEKANELCKMFLSEGVNAIVEQEFQRLVSKVDVLVVCVDQMRLSQPELLRWRERSDPLFVLDLSAPAAVEKFEHAQFVFYGVDDLRRIAQENANIRAQEMERALLIIEEEARDLNQELMRPHMNEAFAELSRKVDRLRQKELEALKLRLSGVADKDWEQIEKMSRRLVDKIIQDPVSELKNRVEEEETWLHFFRKLFKI